MSVIATGKVCIIFKEHAQTEFFRAARSRRMAAREGSFVVLSAPQLGGRLPWLLYVRSVAAMTCGPRCGARGKACCFCWGLARFVACRVASAFFESCGGVHPASDCRSARRAKFHLLIDGLAYRRPRCTVCSEKRDIIMPRNEIRRYCISEGDVHWEPRSSTSSSICRHPPSSGSSGRSSRVASA